MYGFITAKGAPPQEEIKELVHSVGTSAIATSQTPGAKDETSGLSFAEQVDESRTVDRLHKDDAQDRAHLHRTHVQV